MYEFHGWATIRETYKNIDSQEETIENIIEELKGRIKSFNMVNCICDINVFNGEYHLIVSGFRNHEQPASRQLFDLFKCVSEVAKGSYGLLYIHNDEDLRGYDNTFKVYVLCRGTITEKVDTFLSPYIPKVEDAFNFDSPTGE